ncbi:unnamed protein product, partial [Polarella glacialis]
VFCEWLGVDGVPSWVDSLARAVGERSVVDSGPASDVKCPEGHCCQLQAQGVIASFLEQVICQDCDEELKTSEAHWRCVSCCFELCVKCAQSA